MTTFETAVAQAIRLLVTASRQIDQIPPVEEDPVAEYEQLHLSTGALLAAHRARHLLPVDVRIDQPAATTAIPIDHVISARELLVGELQGADPFELLELVADVGNLCQDFRRHDRLH